MRISEFAGRHLAEPAWRRRWFVAATCLALGPVPALGIAGYESALILAPVFAWLGIGIGVDRLRATRLTPALGSTAHRLGQLVAGIAAELTILAILALALQTVAALVWQRNCDPWGGLAFFAFGPLFSAMIGASCGVWGATLARRRGTQVLLASVPFWLCLLVALWRLYVDPVVFAFDPFWGYFSGAIYDEDVAIGPTYRWFRAYNAVAVLAGWAWWATVVEVDLLRVRPNWSRRWPSLSLALALSSVALAVGLRADEWGFHATRSSIEDTLSGHYETQHFVIHYAPRSDAAREIEAIAAEHEFAWHRLATVLGRAPKTPVHSFVFASSGQKRHLMGAGRVEVAPPWRGHLYLNHRPYPHESLHHELAHVFESTIGDPLFGLSLSGAIPNLGLVEGLATALAPRPRDGLDVHDQAAVLEELGLRPSLASVMGPGFWAQASRRAYTVAGSFCRWLLETHGIENLVQLYGNGGDFLPVYGHPLAELETRWLDFLRARPLERRAVDMVEERFRATSLFERPCAHRVAELRQEIAQADARAQWSTKIAALETLCAIEPGQPNHRIALGAALAEAGDYAAAHQVLVDLQGDDLSASLHGYVLEHSGDIDLALGDLTGATELYARALALPLERDRQRLLQLKRLAASDPELAPLVRQYLGLYARDEDTVSRVTTRIYFATRIRALPGYRPLGSYLLALQLMHAQAYDEAVFLLEQSITPGPGDLSLPGPTFLQAALEQLLVCLTITGRYDRAEEALDRWVSGPRTASGDHTEASLWRERLRFLGSYGAAAPTSPH